MDSLRGNRSWQCREVVLRPRTREITNCPLIIDRVAAYVAAKRQMVRAVEA
jgi:hypothetical protein